ncbi:MAG: IclR family transcriptional regulator, partial [Anaerolineales bacterium]|nr:IclR family transcriptional regulator [Anaerolineales bacterium]
PGTQAVRRAIALLKLFSDAQPEWGLADLARAAGLHKATAYRLLTALESEALLARSPDTDAYRLGPAIVALGGVALRANDLRTLCRPELARLAALAQETAALELLTGAEVLILDEAGGDRVISGGHAIGTRWPAHATSTGKAMLAHLPPARLAALLPDPLPRLTPHTLADPAALHADLTQARARGYAVADEELEIGLLAVGAPLHNVDGEVVAAISLAGPKARIPAARIPQLGAWVQQAARRLSLQLGHAPPST